MPAIAAALHFLLAFLLVACLAIELALLKAPAARIPFPTLARVDAVYGLSAVLLLAVGLYRAIGLEKGWVYYSHSIPFLAKLGLFAAIAIASIYPTIQFLRARRGDKAVPQATVDRIRRIVRLELWLVAALVVCASLAAKGIGAIG